VGIFNAWFFRKRFLERVGPYSLEYPVIADSDFLIRCYLNKIKVMPLHSVVYHYFQHAGSLTVNPHGNLQASYLTEKMQLAKKYMHSKSSDLVVKKICAVWYDSTATKLLTAFVRQRRWYPAITTIYSASKEHPKWLFVMIAESPMRLRNTIRKINGADR
jgi:hypothetical protein